MEAGHYTNHTRLSAGGKNEAQGTTSSRPKEIGRETNEEKIRKRWDRRCLQVESGAGRAWRGICPDERPFQAETKAPPAFRRDRSAPMKGQIEAASRLIRGGCPRIIASRSKNRSPTDSFEVTRPRRRKEIFLLSLLFSFFFCNWIVSLRRRWNLYLSFWYALVRFGNVRKCVIISLLRMWVGGFHLNG